MEKKLNIIFDFDSTLTKLEGIDELAKMKNKYDKVKIMTDMAMNGDILFEEIFEKRLNLIQPNRVDMNNLADLYKKNLTHNSVKIVNKLNHFFNVYIVSGGYIESMIKSAKRFNIPKENVHGNELIFDINGNYLNFKRDNYLWQNRGKIKVINKIKEKYNYPTILIGDGYSDLECKKNVDLFICFTGVIKREKVLKEAEKVADNFESIYKIIIDTYPQSS